LKYFASADMTRNTVKPVLDQFNIALAKQQEWVDGFRFSSPAILLQNSMNELAGTSPKHYADFREQVITFSETWRSYFLPRMFNNENMKSEDIASLPDFHYQTERVASSWMTDFFVLLFFIGLLVSCSLLIYRQESLEQMLT
jgi:ABC-2 type transport system permease protein